MVHALYAAVGCCIFLAVVILFIHVGEDEGDWFTYGGIGIFVGLMAGMLWGVVLLVGVVVGSIYGLIRLFRLLRLRLNLKGQYASWRFKRLLRRRSIRV